MRILFISTLNLATNPRLYKEIRLALENGYKVDILCFEFHNWSYEFNQQLKKEIGEAGLTIIPAERKPFFPWALSVFQEKAFRILSHIFPLKGKSLSQAISRRSNLLMKQIRKMESEYDLVIGHNPGALYTTMFAGKKFKCKTGFDIEDYHPGEGSNHHLQALTKKLIGLYLPKMDYVTFAAPLMKARTKEDIRHEGKHWMDVLNFFPESEFNYEDSQENGDLKVVWFSQNVNFKRGLEQVIPLMEKFKDEIQLTLIGNKKEPFFTEYIEQRPWINYLAPMSQKDLNKTISSFDVGLAIEPGKDHNNSIALANKLLTYFQCGLYILASDTPSHIQFFKDFPTHGLSTSLLAEKIESVFKDLSRKKSIIRDGRKRRMENARRHSWEMESQKLLNIWSRLVPKQTTAE